MGIASLLKSYDTIKKHLPTQLLPFALDPGGNYFCIDDNGKIFYYNTDYFDEPNESITFLCNNLKSFIDKMEFEEED